MGNLHKLYEYTDAQVFVCMRGLHDDLDRTLPKVVKPSDSEEVKQKVYINDCIKTIMDGKVPEPVRSHEILIDTKTLDDKAHVERLEREAAEIAKELARKEKIWVGRIKPNIVKQEVMKYTKDEQEIDAREEAVKLEYTEGKVERAAESNATVLKDLVDKALLLFNVYYVKGKHEAKCKVDDREIVIKKAYEGFVAKNFLVKRQGCGCVSGPHMCQIVKEENGLGKIISNVRQPKYICQRCARVSSKKQLLCMPTEINA